MSCRPLHRKNFYRTRWAHRRIILFFILMFVSLWILYYSKPNSGLSSKPCRIPELDPWDESLGEFIDTTTKSVNCSKRYNLFFVDRKGTLKLNRTTMKLYNIKLKVCFYQVITRDGDKGIKIGGEVEFRPPIFIGHEVFCVICEATDGLIVYRYVHVNVMANKGKKRIDDIGLESDDQLSVILIMIDSLSRSHALRFLPKSHEYLTKTLGAFDFKGYMKVGVNTFPNAVALLTGTPETNYHLQTYGLAHLDDMPFIWKEESMRQYIAHLNEDMPHIATFTYLKLGFFKQPVAYYYRLYALAMHLIDPIIVEPLQDVLEGCYGNADHLELQIGYFEQFLSQNTDRLKFALFWNDYLGHSNFNMMSHGDAPLVNLLQWLEYKGHLDRSVLFFGSDHGFRMGEADATYIGRLENNLPLMTVRIPDKVLNGNPDIRRNLEYNTDKLISPYDIYETIRAVVERKFFNAGNVKLPNGITRRSLFQRVPLTRNCFDAGVPERFCSCSDKKPLDLSNPMAKVLGSYCIEYLNDLLEEHIDKCESLTLHNITDIRFSPVMEGDPPDLSLYKYFLSYFELTKTINQYDGRYTIMFFTDPNKGLFELMLDYKTSEDSEDEIVQFIGDPVRVNIYGNESRCVRESLLKQICLCKT